MKLKTLELMKKILFPTDFSKTAENAFLYALNLAQGLNAEILVLNSYEIPVISATNAGQPELLQEVYNTIELNGFEYFKNQAPLLRKIAEDAGYHSINLSFQYEEGTVPFVINTILEKEVVDLIVMGTTGSSTIENKIFGSNTVHVLNNVTVPVLTVPSECEFTELKKIGFATSLKETDKASLHELIALAKPLNAKIECLHVVQDDDTAYEAVLNNWIAEFSPLNVHFHTYEGDDLEETIYDFIDTYEINLVCVVKRQLNFLEKLFTTSLTKKLAYHSYVPVLALREVK